MIADDEDEDEDEDEDVDNFDEDCDDAEEEGFDARLSYLDLVTAAFSSAIFLLFIFASLPLDRAGGGGSPCFADLQLEYADGAAEVELILVHQGLKVLRTSDRRLVYDVASGRTETRGHAREILLTMHRPTFQDGLPRLGFRLLEPADGLWEVYLNSVTVMNAFDAPLDQVGTRINDDAMIVAPASGGCVTNVERADTTPILLRPDEEKTRILSFEVDS